MLKNFMAIKNDNDVKRLDKKKSLTYVTKNAYALVRKETSNLIRKTGKG